MQFRSRSESGSSVGHGAGHAGGLAPGKRTLTEALPILRKVDGGAPAAPRGAPVAPASDPGRPLPESVRLQVEAAFGADFSAVRIHEGPEAAERGALAYTQGEHIYFQPGRFDPASTAGMDLLGHELGHVLQQRDGRAAATQGEGGEILEDSGLEAEADDFGARLAGGQEIAAAPTHAPAPAGGPAQARVDASKLTAGAYAAAFQQLQFAVMRTRAGARLWELCAASADVDLIFENDPELKAKDKQYARTRLLLGGSDINERIFDATVAEKDRAAKIEIRIGVAPDWDKAADLGIALETIAHEFALHANAYTGFIRKLRGGGDLGALSEELGEGLDPMSSSPKLTNEFQHYQLASKSNVVFNVLTEFMQTALKQQGNADAAASLAAEVEKDVADHQGNLMYAPLYQKLAQQRRDEQATFLANQIVGIVTNNPWVRRRVTDAGIELGTLKARLLKQYQPEKLAHLARGYDDAANMERELLRHAARVPALKDLMAERSYLDMELDAFVSFYNSDEVQKLMHS